MRPPFRIAGVAAAVVALVVAFGHVALAAGEATFVRVSPRDPRYLETTDGRPYVPIGMNLIYPPWARTPEGRLALLDEWLAKLQANGGNHIRVWLSNDFWEVEHERAGRYDAEKAKRIDALLATARKHGVRVKMTLEHFREVNPAGASQTWAVKAVHHTSRGGLADTMEEWIASPEARKQFVRRLEFFSARYKDEPAVYGWELWNEMNAIRGRGDHMAWTEAMLPELRRLFPHHLAMQSLGSFDTDGVRPLYRRLATLKGNDVAQVHRYLDLGARLEVCHGPVDVLAAEAVRELLAAKPGRPVMLAEGGAVEPRHTGPFKLYAADRQGIILHDVLFAPFFAGAAGSGQCWHWDSYVAANDLWWQFGRFAAAIKDLDPPAEAFEPVMMDHPQFRVYVLKGRRTLIAWCRDKGSDWKSELAEGKAPAKLAGLKVSFGAHAAGFEKAKVRVYDPWTDRWTDAAMADGAVALPEFSRSIVVRAAR